MTRSSQILLVLIVISLLSTSANARTWTDANGRNLDAELVQYKDGWVQLRKGDGTLVPIHVNRLCTADRAFIIQWLADQEKPEVPVADPQPKINDPQPAGDFTNTIGMKFKLIPAGEFMMGSPRLATDPEDDKTQHQVQITRPFYIGVTEVTQAQWKAVMGTEPWSGEKFVEEGESFAASYISWTDAVEFCKRLSAREGRTYRLPTEAEWEYACRAGTSSAYSFDDDSANLDEHFWYGGIVGSGNCIKEKYAHEVGQKHPNAWGLYDMHGNVHEWCQDWYDSRYYENSPEKDPSGPATGSSRVARGGCWRGYSVYCQSASRSIISPGDRDSSFGFRVTLAQAE